MATTLMQTRQCRSSRTRVSKRVVTVASIVAGVAVCGYGQNLFVATGVRQADSRTRLLMRGVNELAADINHANTGGLNPKYVSSNYRPSGGPIHYNQQQTQRTEGPSGLLLAGGFVIAAAAMILNSSMLATKDSAVSEALGDNEDPIRTTKTIVSSAAVAPGMKTTIVTRTESPPVFQSSLKAADTVVTKQAPPVASSTPLQKDAILKQALAKAEKAGLAPNELDALKAALK